MITNSKGSVSLRTIFLLLANAGMLVWVLSARASAAEPAPSYTSNAGGYTTSTSADENIGQDLYIPEPEEEDAAVTPVPSAQPEETDSYPGSSDPVPDETLNLQMFDWYESDVRYNWFPEDAVQLSGLPEILGDWKAWVKYDPHNESGNPGNLLAYVNIDSGQNDIAVTFDWYWAQYQDDPEGSYESGKSYFNGSFQDGQLYTEGPGILHIKYFCEYNGTQYGVGMMQTKEGIKAIICLMRP